MLIKFCEASLKMIRDRREVFVRRLISGSVSTHEDYRFIVGEIKENEAIEAGLRDMYSNLFESKKGSEEQLYVE